MSSCHGITLWRFMDFSMVTALFVLLFIVILTWLIFVVDVLITPGTQKVFRRLFNASVLASTVQIATSISSYFICDQRRYSYTINIATSLYAINCALLLAVLLFRVHAAFKHTSYELPPCQLLSLWMLYIVMLMCIVCAMVFTILNHYNVYHTINAMVIFFYFYLPAISMYIALSISSSLLFIHKLLRLANSYRASAPFTTLTASYQSNAQHHELHTASKYISLLLCALFITYTSLIAIALSTLWTERTEHLWMSLNVTWNVILLYLQCGFASKCYIQCCCCCIHSFWDMMLMDAINESYDYGDIMKETTALHNGTEMGEMSGDHSDLDVTVCDTDRAYQMLVRNGYDGKYTKRALDLYQRHYGNEYDLKSVEEIVYRLSIKDALKEIQKIQNLYPSRDDIEDILLSFNVAQHYVDAAITMFEIMADILQIGRHNQNIYDLEVITEMTMRLRAKDLKMESDTEKESERCTLKLNQWDTLRSNSAPDRDDMNDGDLDREAIKHGTEENVLYAQNAGNPNEILQGYWKMYSEKYSENTTQNRTFIDVSRSSNMTAPEPFSVVMDEDESLV